MVMTEVKGQGTVDSFVVVRRSRGGIGMTICDSGIWRVFFVTAIYCHEISIYFLSLDAALKWIDDNPPLFPDITVNVVQGYIARPGT